MNNKGKSAIKQMLLGLILAFISLGILVFSQTVQDIVKQKWLFMICVLSIATAVSFFLLGMLSLGAEADKNKKK